MIRSGFSWELWSRSCLLKSAKKEQLGREGGMIGGLVGGEERLARRGLEGGVGGFVAPGKTTIKGLYGKNRRSPHLTVSLSLHTNTTAGCCWISRSSRKLHFLARCTWNLDRLLEIDYYRIMITRTHAHKHTLFLVAAHALSICVYIPLKDSFPKWYWACKQTPLVFITLSSTHMHVQTPTRECLHMPHWHTLEKKDDSLANTHTHTHKPCADLVAAKCWGIFFGNTLWAT